jgi:N6-L-threonylcarbamoyladenine synthase
LTRILGIETSCDETAVAVVRDGQAIEANVIASQTDLHARYGGVVPEQASRAHLRAIVPALDEALAVSGADWGDIDAIAVTHGPGLAGALLVGLNVAKGLSFARSLPLIGVNHLEGHVCANWLDGLAEPTFPLVALIVSGGHSDVVLSTAHSTYRRLGHTRDDAAGEAFDKVARLLGLGFPGGPPIERAALGGDPTRFPLPRAWLEPESWDFSFSGLKTAVRHLVRDLGLDPDVASAEERRAGLPVADIAASFQAAVVEVLAVKAARAAAACGARCLALGGGVAANRALLRRVEDVAQLPVVCPPPRLCTDNAAMIASAGFFRFGAGQRDGLTLDVLPSLAIDA